MKKSPCWLLNPFDLLYKNEEFDKAAVLLAHPAVIFSLLLLFLNDHILRHYWPSWVTGKLGDFAWLLFAPFILAAFFAWLVPAKKAHREKWVFGLAFLSLAIVFIVIKIFPIVNLLATRITSNILQIPIIVISDPTDLIALPVLGISYYLLKKTPVNRHASQKGWIILPIAALLTLANSGMPDPGIYCFDDQESSITAQAGYSSFVSSDGGKTWQTPQVGLPRTCEQKYSSENEWIVVPGPQENIAYRFKTGQKIDVSLDSGNYWKTIRTFDAIPEAKKQYYLKSRQGYVQFTPGPLDAVADPDSGNMLFAMGQQGVLILTGEGTWEWSRVGEYEPLDTFPNVDAFGLLLGGMVYLAAGLGLLIFASLALRWAGGPWRIAVLILGWIAWLLVDIFFPPAITFGYSGAISSMGIIGFFILALPLVIEQLIRLARRVPAVISSLAALGAVGAVLYLLPYLLWLYSTLPSLMWATIFSGLITAALLTTGFFVSRNRQNTLSSHIDTKSSL